MPYREKVAWLSLTAMMVTFGPYFVAVAISPPGDELPNIQQLRALAVAALSQLVLLGAGYLYLRRTSRGESKLPDERDQAISRRSIRYAYGVLTVGMIVVGCVMPFSSGGWTIVNAALLMIVLAEVVHYGAVVLGYRRYA